MTTIASLGVVGDGRLQSSVGSSNISGPAPSSTGSTDLPSTWPREADDHRGPAPILESYTEKKDTIPVLSHSKVSKSLDSPPSLDARRSSESKESKHHGEKEVALGLGAPSGAEEEVIPELSKGRMTLIAIGMMLTYFLGTASATSVTLVIPQIARSLEISELSAQWVVSAYALASGCGLLFAGRLADLYGRKLLYLTGLGIFAVFSILSAVIRNRVGLCIVRAICGLGLAIASPAGFGIVGVSFRVEPARTIAFACFGLGAPVGAGFGTILGGAVAGASENGWSYLFYILAGAAAFPIVTGVIVIPRDRRTLRGAGKDRRIDWFGGFLVTAGLCLFIFSLTQSGIAERGWREPYIPAVLVISILLLVCFGFWERYLEHHSTLPPIMKFSLFTKNNFKITYIILSCFLITIAIFGFVYTSTIWYQNHLHYSALNTAVRLIPANVTGFIAAGGVMFLGPRVSAPRLMMIGCTLSGIACMLYAVEPAGTIYWACEFIAMMLLPWGIDFTVCLGNIMISNLVDEDEQSVGGGLFNTSIQIGGALGVSIAALLSTSRTNQTGDLVSGLKDTFWMLAAFAWVVVPIVFLGLRRVKLAKDIKSV